jgi:chaperone required for assembly of F1-ATPase
MEKKDEYQKMLNSQLKEWNVLITMLAKKVENAGADVKLMYLQELDEIRGQQRDAVKQIEELGSASDNAWESAKISMDMVGYNLGTGLARAMAKFR